MNTYELQSRHRMDTPSVDEQRGKHNGPTRAPGDGLLQRCKMGDTSAMLELAWFGDERNRKQIVTFLYRCYGLSINALRNLSNVYS